MTEKTRVEIYGRQPLKVFTKLYTESAQTELLRYFEALENSTAKISIVTPDDVMLTDAGRTRSAGYKYTAAAFKQVAQIVAPGAAKLIPDIAGTATRSAKTGTTHAIDHLVAVNIWNRLVALRYQLLQRYVMIVNEHERTIDGLVGSKHEQLSNTQLYRSAVSAVASATPDMQVYAAKIIGRQFALWFRNRTPQIALTVNGKQALFYKGVYFTNGEAAGTSARGTPAILSPYGVCLASYKRHGRRVVHTGRDFMRRLGEMFAVVTQTELPWDKLTNGAGALLTTPLGFAQDQTQEQRRDNVKRLVNALCALGVQRNIAVSVIDLALTTGRRTGSSEVSPQLTQHAHTDRRVLDVFVPLLGIARRLDIRRRERMEQIAYELLMGRFLH